MKLTRNYKLVILISAIIISSAAGIGIWYFAIQWSSNSEDYTYQIYYGDLSLEYGVKSCCDFCEKNETLEIYVPPLKNEVIFNQILNLYCCPSITDPTYFTIEIELLNNNLTIREVFDPKGSPVCKCICPYGINGRISNLTRGSYNLTFILDNRYVNQTNIIQVFEIII